MGLTKSEWLIVISIIVAIIIGVPLICLTYLLLRKREKVSEPKFIKNIYKAAAFLNDHFFPLHNELLPVPACEFSRVPRILHFNGFPGPRKRFLQYIKPIRAIPSAFQTTS